MVYMLCWNLYIARSILFPFKLCAVAWCVLSSAHERVGPPIDLTTHAP